jgi:RNA 2',3'-cyclic 3'-phosphodiesterase
MNAEPKRRLFVAIELPEAVRTAIEDLVRPLRSLDGLRWVPLENLHLTLAFLGWVETETIGAIEERLARAAAGAQSFEARLAGAGRFPERGKARVLWVGFDDAAGSLTELAGDVQGVLEDLFELEDRPFRPHVTVARARRPVAVTLPPAVPARPQAFAVTAMTLFRSHLGGDHARYEALQRWRLGAQPSAIP